MNWMKLVWRNLVYYRNSHVWLLLGTMLSAAIIVGALGVGDSLRHSLKKIALQRLGKVEYALSLPDRLIQNRLAQDIAQKGNIPVLYALQLEAFAKNGTLQAKGVNVWGIDPEFWGQNLGQAWDLGEEEGIINPKLALQLGLKEGDTFLLRIDRASLFPKESSFSARGQDSLPLRLKVQKIQQDLGNFSLRIHQIDPYNVFVSYSWLAKKMQISGYANVFLAGKERGISCDAMNNLLEKCFQIQDIGIRLEQNPEKSHWYLKTPRVFLDIPLAQAALKADPQAQGILTYFVNSIQKGEKNTPYSFLCAPGEPIVPSSTKDDEILVNEWLAEDLGILPGDSIEVSYFIPGNRRKMEQSKALFRVRQILPMDERTHAPYLMPDFPGLATSENCKDWKSGISIDFSKIRNKDEEYWKQYKGTPKGFITLKAAQKLWENRYGSLTSIRYPNKPKEEILGQIQKNLIARDFGLGFIQIQAQSLESSSQGVDFAQLFLGLSFFLVVSALLLVGLLFAWNRENRSQENANLMALGLLPSEIRRLFLMEGSILAFAGVLLGACMGIFYAKSILYTLENLWYEAVRTSLLHFHIEASSLILGCLVSWLMIFATIFWTSRSFSLSPEQQKETEHISYLYPGSPQKKRISFVLFCLCLALVGLIFIFAIQGQLQESFGIFFAAGFLMLLSSIFLCYFLSLHGRSFRQKEGFSILVYAFRNSLRKRSRSLAMIALLSSSLFLVVSVAANRNNLDLSAHERSSGTGGFALWCETSLPFFHDPESLEGIQELGFSQEEAKVMKISAIRSRQGDDASCLNLNRVQNPVLWGIPALSFEKSRAFSFVTAKDKSILKNPWSFLDKEISPDTIPAFADHNTILWGLGKKIGDRIPYQDERGNTFYVQLVASLEDSIFQGKILISERFFLHFFPSDAGIQKFLVDADHSESQSIAKTLNYVMEDYGIETTMAKDRLYEFQSVPNTYLNIFLALGGLGIALGTCGFAVLIKRNIIERHKEIAILQSLGFQNQGIVKLFLLEYLSLVLVSILCALFCSLVALFPSLKYSYSQIPWLWILSLLSGIFLNSLLCAFWAIKSGMSSHVPISENFSPGYL